MDVYSCCRRRLFKFQISRADLMIQLKCYYYSPLIVINVKEISHAEVAGRSKFN